MVKKIIPLVLSLFLVNASNSETIRIEKSDQTLTIEAEKIEGILHISVSSLANIFGSQVYFNPLTKKAVIEIGNHLLKLSLFSAYVEVDQTAYNLTYPVQLKKGDLYIPIVTLAPILDIISSEKVIWEEEQKTLKFQKKEFNLLGLKMSEKSNGILLEIYLAENLKYEIYSSDNRWLNISFFSGKLNESEFSAQKNQVIEEIKIYPFEISTQISIKFSKPFGNYRGEIRNDPLRLQVSLGNSQLNSNPRNSNGPKNWDNSIDVIVVDPGHGGEDYGAIGPSGLTEKEITLDIALRLEKLLKTTNFKVILTRADDTFIPLAERTQIANRNGADLFVSIHANSAKRKNVSGSETYFLDQAKNDEARAVAAIENASLRFEKQDTSQLTDLDFILLDMVQNQFLKESSDLAFMIQERLGKNLPIPNRGVDQAGFFVLNKAYMPSVLVETAFISNKTEEKLLKNSSFRQKIAEAILESIQSFKQKYESLR